jgi:hypothetical protein
MTAYQTQHDYNRTASVLEEMYSQEEEGPFHDAVVELYATLKRAAEADDKATELACLKKAQETLSIMRDFQEERGKRLFTVEGLQNTLARAQHRLEQGYPPDESMRGRGGISTGRGLSVAAILCLAA